MGDKQVVANEEWRAKAVFIMPPTLTYWQWLKKLLARSPQDQWARARRGLSDLGIHLPPYDRKGCVFTIDSHKQFDNCLPLSILGADHIGELIEKRGRTEHASSEDEPVWFDQFPWKWTVLAPGFAYSLSILMLVASLNGLFFQLFNIPSGSKKPTLLVGDYISVNTSAYGIDVTKDLPFDLEPAIFFREEPKRGDLVVYKLPTDRETVFVGRVVGLPGDEVQMRDGVL
jgi:hypothetical protein